MILKFKEILLLIITFIISEGVKSQNYSDNHTTSSEVLKNELKWFIDTLSINNKGAFNIYEVYFYKNDNNELCSTVQYFMNEGNLYSTVANYYFDLDKHTILAIVKDQNTLTLVNDSLQLKLKKYNSIEPIKKLTDKALTDSIGVTGIFEAYNFCLTPMGVNSKFYKDSGDLNLEDTYYMDLSTPIEYDNAIWEFDTIKKRYKKKKIIER